MLVLTRKLKESIIIGDEIEVVVLGIKGDTVKLGIKAPVSVPVHRKEVYEQILKENITASQSDLSLEEIHSIVHAGKL